MPASGRFRDRSGIDFALEGRVFDPLLGSAAIPAHFKRVVDRFTALLAFPHRATPVTKESSSAASNNILAIDLGNYKSFLGIPAGV